MSFKDDQHSFCPSPISKLHERGYNFGNTLQRSSIAQSSQNTNRINEDLTGSLRASKVPSLKLPINNDIKKYLEDAYYV
jgi:hypothetical protein